ncbi:MAG: High-affinity branched-chain amino acid transport ATP-binding protein LivF [Planctomycetes bacterium]|nr:High-affinity branched-chain amino acid transport ATP-binding protein LivF [Planctomycetota bacterium]
MTAPLLELRSVSASYGPIRALKDVTLRVGRGEIVALIGANGAGKTSALMTISQIVRASAGDVLFDGRSILGMPPDRVTAAGICHVPEGRRIFARLTVEENLRMGAFLVRDAAVVAARMEAAFAVFPRLRERRMQTGGTLSGGEQQMLAIARALMLEPKLLLLDEPSLGLAPLIVRQIFDVVADLRRRGVTVLLVEQNARMALRLADRAYVLETGEIRREGPGAELLDDPAIREAYLGG